MNATLIVDAESGNDALKEAMRQLWNDLYENRFEDIFSVDVEETI
jgi:TolB-like protein